MARWTAKLFSVFLLFVTSFVPALIPIKVSEYFARLGERGTAVVSWTMCFGGGVFFSVYMLHMAPDARAIIDESLIKPKNINYPLSDFIMACGFFVMLFVDTAVHRFTDARRRRHSRANDLESIGNGENIAVCGHTQLTVSRKEDANGC
jgi:zinc transporter 1/2/3